MKSKLKGIPKLNSNDVYLVLKQTHNCSVLGDRGYTELKASFWVGARALNHQSKVEKGIALLDEVSGAHTNAKMHIFIEFQYSESLDFFGLFNKIDRLDCLTKAPSETIKRVFYALQYQEYVRDDTAQKKQRCIAFPKVLILESGLAKMTPLTSYVRVYERACLDQYCPITAQDLAASSLAFLILEGHYVNQAGQTSQDMAASEPLTEVVTAGHLVLGGKASKELRAFTETLARSYEAAHSTEGKFACIFQIWSSCATLAKLILI